MGNTEIQCRTGKRAGWWRRLPSFALEIDSHFSRLCHWRRQWQPTPVLLPGKSHGQRSLVGCSPWGREESDTTEWLHFHFHSLGSARATLSGPSLCRMKEETPDGCLVMKCVNSTILQEWTPAWTSLAVQWLRLHAANSGGVGFDPWPGN